MPMEVANLFLIAESVYEQVSPNGTRDGCGVAAFVGHVSSRCL
jgi:hypothetical protein